ncbi:MAG: peptidylprolyl isomerase [Candidatus Thorarchaeota archaeon]
MPTKIKIQTNKGDIIGEFWNDDAINTVKNFVTLAQSGYYDGLTFHRVLPDFVIQGGCPEGTGRGGPGYRIPCETEGSRQKHEPGSFSMAHAGRDTGGSQFFIVLTREKTKHLDGDTDPFGQKTGHTVFGKTIEGLDVVKSIRQGDKMLKVEVLEVDPVIETHVLQKM